MIRNRLKYVLIGILAITSYALSYTADNRAQIPPYVMEYLKEHEVSQELKEKLDTVFLNPAVYRDLTMIYNHNNMHSATVSLEKSFSFSFYNERVFFCDTLFPHLIFKIGLGQASDYFRNELKNISRIRMAQIVNDYAPEFGIAIEAPVKKAYFLPHSMTVEGTVYYGPRMVVVASRKTLEPER